MRSKSYAKKIQNFLGGGGVRTNSALILSIILSISGVGVVTKEEIILSLLNFGPPSFALFYKIDNWKGSKHVPDNTMHIM